MNEKTKKYVAIGVGLVAGIGSSMLFGKSCNFLIEAFGMKGMSKLLCKLGGAALAGSIGGVVASTSMRDTITIIDFVSELTNDHTEKKEDNSETVSA